MRDINSKQGRTLLRLVLAEAAIERGMEPRYVSEYTTEAAASFLWVLDERLGNAASAVAQRLQEEASWTPQQGEVIEAIVKEWEAMGEHYPRA